MEKYEYEFLDAKITQQTSPEDAYRKLEDMALKQIESLRKLTKDVSVLLLCNIELESKFKIKRSFKVQDLRKTNKEELVKKALQEYDESLEKYNFKNFFYLNKVF